MSPTPTPAPVPRPTPALSLRTGTDLLYFTNATLRDKQPTSSDYLPALRTVFQSLNDCGPTATTDSPEEACKMWLACADVGVMVLDTRSASAAVPDSDWSWADDAADLVERAIERGLVIAQKRSPLSAYKLTFTLLHARLATHQGNKKFAHSVLRRLIQSFAPNDPRAHLYTAHLALISHLDSDTNATLAALQKLHDIAEASGDKGIVALCKVERLRVFACADMWESVEVALQDAEDALGLSPEFPPELKDDEDEDGASKEKPPPPAPIPTPIPTEPWAACLMMYTLVLGVVYYTHNASARGASVRLAALHRHMDAGASKLFPDALVRIPVQKDFVVVRSTHPAALFRLTFLLSSVSKRDPLSLGAPAAEGLKGEPKKRTFAREGLALAERDGEVLLAEGATLRDAMDLDGMMARIRADLLCEMVSIAITCCEFNEAEDRLGQLIAHLRNANLWDAYAPRVCLHEGHLAQTLLRPGRASACYRLAAKLGAGETALAARVCDLGLRWGVEAGGAEEWKDKKSAGKKRKRSTVGVGAGAVDWEEKGVEPVVREEVLEVIKLCEAPGTSASIKAAGHVLAACVADEVLRIKQHLKQALELAGTANDLRLPVLALTSSLYADTAAPHAHVMLRTARKIARDLSVAPLEAWLAARLAELYKRTSKDERANKALLEVKESEARVKAIRERKRRR
ncbi:hypothetical protein EXIGLDRAFT_717023 [Exidia glandulosa HHB12029]|uniref:Uncharacterized protein n=1 Tax=Exidia glandulosa HHB12029 TaxID=1314781 RepID=A0A166AMY3_EXIGL|nr:hypothetical protein EXIGLDRAFT_717023 [Exidia glandulosa HHB12029]